MPDSKHQTQTAQHRASVTVGGRKSVQSVVHHAALPGERLSLVAIACALRPQSANLPVTFADQGPGHKSGVSDVCTTNARAATASKAGWLNTRSARAGATSFSP